MSPIGLDQSITLLDRLHHHASQTQTSPEHPNPSRLAIVERHSGLSKSYPDLLEDIRTLSDNLTSTASLVAVHPLTPRSQMGFSQPSYISYRSHPHPSRRLIDHTAADSTFVQQPMIMKQVRPILGANPSSTYFLPVICGLSPNSHFGHSTPSTFHKQSLKLIANWLMLLRRLPFTSPFVWKMDLRNYLT